MIEKRNADFNIPNQNIPKSWVKCMQVETLNNGERRYYIDERCIDISNLENGQEIKTNFIKFLNSLILILNDFPVGKHAEGSFRYKKAAAYVRMGKLLNKPALTVDFDYASLGIKVAKIWEEVSKGNIELRITEKAPWTLFSSADIEQTGYYAGAGIPRIYLEDKNIDKLPEYSTEIIEILYKIYQAINDEYTDPEVAFKGDEDSIELILGKTAILAMLNNFTDDDNRFARVSTQGFKEFSYHMNRYIEG